MKKVKIILTAVTVLTVVGGTLAFRAKNFNQGDRYCSDTYVGSNCPTSKDFVSTPVTGSLSKYCTTESGTPCQQQLEQVELSGVAGN